MRAISVVLRHRLPFDVNDIPGVELALCSVPVIFAFIFFPLRFARPPQWQCGWAVSVLGYDCASQTDHKLEGSDGSQNLPAISSSCRAMKLQRYLNVSRSAVKFGPSPQNHSWRANFLPGSPLPHLFEQPHLPLSAPPGPVLSWPARASIVSALLESGFL